MVQLVISLDLIVKLSKYIISPKKKNNLEKHGLHIQHNLTVYFHQTPLLEKWKQIISIKNQIKLK